MRKCLSSIRSFVDKFFFRLDRSGGLEAIDFVKDLIYTGNVDHKSYEITLFLWAFVLITPLFTASQIAIMSAEEYVD